MEGLGSCCFHISQTFQLHGEAGNELFIWKETKVIVVNEVPLLRDCQQSDNDQLAVEQEMEEIGLDGPRWGRIAGRAG